MLIAYLQAHHQQRLTEWCAGTNPFRQLSKQNSSLFCISTLSNLTQCTSSSIAGKDSNHIVGGVDRIIFLNVLCAFVPVNNTYSVFTRFRFSFARVMFSLLDCAYADAS
jgi:hypothetical protein